MNPTCQLSVCGFPKVNKLVIKPISTSDLDVLRKANATQKKDAWYKPSWRKMLVNESWRLAIWSSFSIWSWTNRGKWRGSSISTCLQAIACNKWKQSSSIFGIEGTTFNAPRFYDSRSNSFQFSRFLKNKFSASKIKLGKFFHDFFHQKVLNKSVC